MDFGNHSSTKYVISPDAISQPLHGEVVVLDMRTEAYFGLNQAGALVWEALAVGETVDAMAQLLIDRYGISHEDALQDVTTLIHDLERRELIYRKESWTSGHPASNL